MKKDLNASTIRALKGQDGSDGLDGFDGVNGSSGGLDPAKISYVTGTTTAYAPGGAWYYTLPCPYGTKVLSGGYVVISGGTAIPFGSYASPDGSGWTVHISNFEAYFNSELTVYAVCAAP